ncbi:MAG TPA: hypothetical protein VE089_08145 [Nitrososphaeraceae archaeon]|nr:hypothetical protein [Nitrososphaeraceae archaeon]
MRIVGDEVKEPYIPGSILITSGDKVKWINTDVEAHTVTSGLGKTISDLKSQGLTFDNHYQFESARYLFTT